MRRRHIRIGVLEIIAIVMGLAAAVYTGWVIHDVSTAGPDRPIDLAEPLPTNPTRSVQVAPPKAPTSPPPLGPFRAAASEASTILVIGDSTGAGSGSWVDLVAENLGETRRVSLHDWDEAASQFVEVPTTYGAVGRRLDVWNLSYQGIAADYPERMGDLPQPDVVLLNIGHDRRPRAVERAAVVTTDAIDRRWGDIPTAFVLQNPSVGDAEQQQDRAVERLTQLAAYFGYPLIDVYAAFKNADRDQPLVTQQSRPNEDGSRLWADVVVQALSAG